MLLKVNQKEVLIIIAKMFLQINNLLLLNLKVENNRIQEINQEIYLLIMKPLKIIRWKSWISLLQAMQTKREDNQEAILLERILQTRNLNKEAIQRRTMNNLRVKRSPKKERVWPMEKRLTRSNEPKNILHYIIFTYISDIDFI